MTEVTTIDHWLDGKPAEGTGTRTAEVFDPATGAVSAHARLASERDVDTAVSSARAAFTQWRGASLSKRTAVLFAMREIVSERRRELAEVITAQHGKVLGDALGEVQRGLEVIEFACGIPHQLKGSHSEQVSTNVDVHSIRQPVGVTVGITPVQLPGDGAVVDVSGGDRMRQLVHPQALRT
ncbi:MAG: aldehyde dehydrogenase family protein [Microthrixaceae bacterium]|nr:aldehyde dehydrogenase family protein [Microthrixaceae bacterium]